VLTKLAVGLFAGGIVFRLLLPELSIDVGVATLDSFWVGSALVVVLTGLYTIVGGMRAVAYTEAIQTVVLVAGSLLLTVFGLTALGGWSELRAALDPDLFNLWKPIVPAGMEGVWAPVREPGRVAWYFNANYPWPGMLLCAPIIGLWYWCTDQYIVQRALGAADEREARRGSIFGAFLKLLPVFIFIVPGMIAVALAKTVNVPGLAGLIGADGAVSVDSAQAVYPMLVQHVMPAGLRGLVVAALLAALMSSLSSLFNSTATLFTVDIYEKLRPQASQARIVAVGRLATLVVTALGLLWIPVMPLISGGGLYQYLQNVQSYLAPPITAVFLLGLFNSRINARGATWGLGLGFVLGFGKLVVQAVFGEGKIETPGVLAAVGDFNFLYFSGVLFLICVATCIVASRGGEPPDRDKIKGLTFDSIDRAAVRASWDFKDVLMTAVVLALVATLYLYFSFWIG
jgi:SSS family solute:Na+ symporter